MTGARPSSASVKTCSTARAIRASRRWILVDAANTLIICRSTGSSGVPARSFGKGHCGECGQRTRGETGIEGPLRCRTIEADPQSLGASASRGLRRARAPRLSRRSALERAGSSARLAAGARATALAPQLGATRVDPVASASRLLLSPGLSASSSTAHSSFAIWTEARRRGRPAQSGGRGKGGAGSTAWVHVWGPSPGEFRGCNWPSSRKLWPRGRSPGQRSGPHIVGQAVEPGQL